MSEETKKVIKGFRTTMGSLSKYDYGSLVNRTAFEFDDLIAACNASMAGSGIVTNRDVSWSDVQNYVQSGMAPVYYKIGDQLVDTWTDTASGTSYECPMHVAHYGSAELEDGSSVSGMYLQWHYTTPFGIQFNRNRAVYACPTSDTCLKAGTKYKFTFNYSSGKVANQTIVFTLTKDVPVGGSIAMNSGLGDVAVANWVIYNYASDGITVLETVTPTIGSDDSATDLGTLQSTTRQGNLNCAQEVTWGYNRYKTSALRQWLNSDKGKGSWWTKQDKFDIAPNELATRAGFLSGVPSDLLAVVKPIKVVTYANNVNDSGAQDITYDRIFAPSMMQQYCNPQASGEGEPWDYWKSLSTDGNKFAQYGTYTALKQYSISNNTSAQNVWMRSAILGHASTSWYVSPSGYVSSNCGCGGFAVAPALFIA